MTEAEREAERRRRRILGESTESEESEEDEPKPEPEVPKPFDPRGKRRLSTTLGPQHMLPKVPFQPHLIRV